MTKCRICGFQNDDENCFQRGKYIEGKFTGEYFCLPCYHKRAGKMAEQMLKRYTKKGGKQ